LSKSLEGYLEAILILRKTKGNVRSVDLAKHMGYSKASISHAVKCLRIGGFLVVNDAGYLCLTSTGQTVAEKIYERHQFFTQWLIDAGIDLETAEQDACRMEHTISQRSFEQIRKKYQKQQSN